MASDAAALSYLALGDSYTIGESVPPESRWPVQLARALRDEGVALDDPRIIANTGWTTDELEWGMDSAEPLGHFDFVSLLVGVNNQYRNRSAVGYGGELHNLLKRAIALAHGRADRVMVLSIPDWGVTPFARASGRDRAQIAGELDAYNEASREICAARGVRWIDITWLTRAEGADTEVVDDGLHPSPAMYSQWVARLLAETPWQ